MAIKKIKEMDKKTSLGGVRFRHPETGEVCIWASQWGYLEGKAGVWFKKPYDDNPDQVYPICIDSLEEVLEWELV